ncbi:MAG: hypothetical protein ACFE0K_01785 [Alcanivorax sp.]|uniref:hypothetical protein n=1 Tax=Alcanivorax sp. TaxID=1872427 RepID=UPI003DA6DE09
MGVQVALSEVKGRSVWACRLLPSNTMTPHDVAKTMLTLDALFFRLAIVAWLVAAIAPIDGIWFAGVGVFVVSVMGSVVMLANLTPDYIGSLAEALGLLALFMPGYNLIFLWGLFRFSSPGTQPWSWWNLLLYVCSLHASCYAFAFLVVPSDVSLTVAATGIRWVFVIWSGSLLLSALAFLVRCYRLRRLLCEE